MSNPFAATETALADQAVAVFSNATATYSTQSAAVVIDRETPDVFTGTRTDRWIMQIRAGALTVAVGNQVTVTGQHAGTYRVLDVDEADGLVNILTLGFVA